MDIAKLCQLLSDIADLEPNKWKSRAYRTAVGVLKSTDPDKLSKLSNFSKLPGIGGSIDAKIKEFKDKGSISKLNELRILYPNKLDKNLYKLRKSYVTRRITYDEATELLSKLMTILNKAGISNDLVTVCGSYRRHKDLIGDLDVVVNSTDKSLINKLHKLLADDYKLNMDGDKHINFIIDNNNMTPVDIIFTAPESYIPCVTYLTGSSDFNIKMRAKAKSLSYKLNQYGLYDKSGVIIPLSDELDLFNKLKMNYVSPENR